MNVGEAANRCDLSAKTIRYYEDIGLVVPNRQANGYRDYSESDICKLQFIQRSRSLGFSIEDCRNLLSLYEDTSRASADVKAIAEARLTDIRRKIEELESLHATLSVLVNACHGDHRPECPIIEDLAGGKTRAAQ